MIGAIRDSKVIGGNKIPFLLGIKSICFVTENIQKIVFFSLKSFILSKEIGNIIQFQQLQYNEQSEKGKNFDKIINYTIER